MSKDFRMKLEKVFDFLGEIIAFVVAVVCSCDAIVLRCSGSALYSVLRS